MSSADLESDNLANTTPRPSQSKAKPRPFSLHFCCRTELVSSSADNRNWRGIVISLLVIGAIIGLITLSVILVSPPKTGPKVSGRHFSLDDIITGRFEAPTFRGKWISSTEVVFRDDQGGLSLLNVGTLKAITIVSNLTFRTLNMDNFEMSPNKQYLLVRHSQHQKADHSSGYSLHPLAKYSVLEINITDARISDGQHLEAVTPFPDQEGHQPLPYVTWRPGNSDALIMVHENNLYMKESPLSPVVHQITNTGEPGHIYNGCTDFLYKEYILKSSSALWLSQDGTWIVYASFNDTLVTEADIPLYTDKYTKMIKIRYPQVDTVNPRFTLWAVDLRQSIHLHQTVPENKSNTKSFKAKDLVPPIRVKNQLVGVWDHYFTSVRWTDNSEGVVVVWRNRAQNISVHTHCKPPMWFCEELFIEESKPHQWTLTENTLLLGENASTFVVLAPLHSHPKGSVMALYKHRLPSSDTDLPFPDGSELTPPKSPLYPAESSSNTWGDDLRSIYYTPRNFTLYKLLAWDQNNNNVYLTGSPNSSQQNHPSGLHLFRVSLFEYELLDSEECLTCDLDYTDPPCQHYTPFMGKENFEQVILHCEGPGVPHTVLFSLETQEVLMHIHNNSELQELSAEMAWPRRKDFKVKLEDGFQAQVRLTVPPELDEEEYAYIHPVIVAPGGGPGDQRVTHKWGVGWNTYIASNKSWVVLEMDVRGSGGQSIDSMMSPAWNLGKLEVRDYLAITRYVVDNLQYLDNNRIAVWGWGHSGYNAAMMLAQDTHHLLNCAIAINPITDWRNYASYYSEKYMGSAEVRPGANFRGYDDSSLENQAWRFFNRSLFLIAGTADTNIHYAQMLKFTRALTQASIMFRQHSYADEGHDLANIKEHLYTSLEKYLDSFFPPYTEDQLNILFQT